MKLTTKDPRISQFCDLINKGIEDWVLAGQLLVEIRKDNAEAFDVIMDANPHLTFEVLETFERIGKQEIYPYLLVDPSPAARRLVCLPYSQQVKLYGGSIAVVSGKGGSRVIRKKVSHLTEKESALVFDVGRVRTPDEQVKILRLKAYRTTDTKGRMPGPVLPQNRTPTTILADTEAYEENPPDAPVGSPKSLLLSHLGVIQDSLLKSREQLCKLVPNTSKLDDHITRGLTEVGKLRNAVTEL